MTMRTGQKWGVLFALSLVFGVGMELVGVPAALLLGPMIAGVICGARGFGLRVPVIPFQLAQATVGVLVASSISMQVLTNLAEDWPIYLGVVILILMASAALGLMLSHWNVLPGTTAIWGSWPGAATAMTLMAEAFGADVRLVAFMQYLRVLFVALAASLLAGLWGDGSGSAMGETVWFPAPDWSALAVTAALIVGGSWLGRLSRIPAGQMLVPMLVGIALNVSELGHFQLPEWFLALAYAMLGWRIGLGFSTAVLAYAWRALPKIIGSILALLAFSGGLAALLHFWLGIDPVTAYLATSPGGMDSVAIIAASTQVDLPFVMALQTMRFLIVLIFGPPLARFAARRSGRRD